MFLRKMFSRFFLVYLFKLFYGIRQIHFIFCEQIVGLGSAIKLSENVPLENFSFEIDLIEGLKG